MFQSRASLKKRFVGTDNILNPEAPLALRLSGQLLLGVVKIYSRKVAFLFDDCNDALTKVTKVIDPKHLDGRGFCVYAFACQFVQVAACIWQFQVLGLELCMKVELYVFFVS